KSGVTVNAVCPGFTETDLLEGSIDNIMKKTGRSREQAVAELSKHNPQARLVTPSEVADAVLWLCGEGASAITGQAIAVAGGEVSPGGDGFEIIGPLIQMDTKGLTAFTRMTGDLVKAMRACPQPIVAAVDGICAGAGAIVAMASDMRLAATGAKVAFLFNKV